MTRKLILISAFMLLSINNVAFAEDSCTWAVQPDGSTAGTCVDDNGKLYCVSCAKGTAHSTACPVVKC
jgi:hypothetical protein